MSPGFVRSENEFIVNDHDFSARGPRVTHLANGNFLVVWGDSGNSTTNARILDPDGNPLGDLFFVNGLDVTALSNGGFLAVREVRYDRSSTDYLVELLGQAYDASGTPVGPAFRINEGGTGDNEFVELITPLDGGFAVTWHQVDGVNSYVGRGIQFFDDAGNQVGEDLVLNVPRAASIGYSAGGIVATWWFDSGNGYTVAGQRFDLAGNPVGPQFVVATHTGAMHFSDVVMLANGGFAVAWAQRGTLSSDVMLRVYDASGAPLGEAFPGHSAPAGYQGNPEILALPSGEFILMWEDDSQGNLTDLKMQLFDATGARIGEERFINQKTELHQDNVDADVLKDGQVVFVWENQISGGDQDISATLFIRASAGNAGDDVFAGTVGQDSFSGGAGNDVFTFGPGTFAAADRVDGGGGDDRLELSGAYDHGVVFEPRTVKDVETIVLRSAAQGYHSYNLTMSDGNLATTQRMHIDGSALRYGEALMFYGAAETDASFRVTGGASNDYIFGSQQADILQGGLGNDYVRGHGGNDLVRGGGGNDYLLGDGGDDTFDYHAPDEVTGDYVDGGAGKDRVLLQGQFSGGTNFASATLVSVESIVLASAAGGYNAYNLTMGDNNVAAGGTLFVDGSALRYGEALMFYGQAERDGSFTIRGGASNDYIFGGQQADLIRGGLSGDYLSGEGGDDRFTFFGPDEIRGDQIHGGAGYDTMVLDGNFSGGTAYRAMSGIERILVTSAPAGGYQSYNMTIRNADVAASATLEIDASALRYGEALMFYGTAEADGRFLITGGASNDYIFGGQQGDVIRGGLGRDYLQGAGGADRFVYGSAAEATSLRFDIIDGFDRSVDRIDLPGTVSGFGGHVEGGRLDTSTFDADLAAAMHGVLGSGQAASFNAGAGDFAGRSFLVVDGNGVAGYQAGEDFVIEMRNLAAPLGGTPDYFI